MEKINVLELKELIDKSNGISVISGKAGVGKTTILLSMADENSVFISTEVTPSYIKSSVETYGFNEKLKAILPSIIDENNDYSHNHLKEVITQCINDVDVKRIILDNSILGLMERERAGRFINLLNHSGKSVIIGIQVNRNGLFDYSDDAFNIVANIDNHGEKFDKNITLLKGEIKSRVF